MADHRADGSIDVTIPHVALATTLADREFDNAASGGNGTTRLQLSAAGQSAVLVRIQSANDGDQRTRVRRQQAPRV